MVGGPRLSQLRWCARQLDAIIGLVIAAVIVWILANSTPHRDTPPHGWRRRRHPGAGRVHRSGRSRGPGRAGDAGAVARSPDGDRTVRDHGCVPVTVGRARAGPGCRNGFDHRCAASGPGCRPGGTHRRGHTTSGAESRPRLTSKPSPPPGRGVASGDRLSTGLAISGMIIINVGPFWPENVLQRLYLLPTGRACVLVRDDRWRGDGLLHA